MKILYVIADRTYLGEVKLREMGQAKEWQGKSSLGTTDGQRTEGVKGPLLIYQK